MPTAFLVAVGVASGYTKANPAAPSSATDNTSPECSFHTKMARGKPSGIRRKLAREKEKLSEKLSVSQVGGVAEHNEFHLIRTIEEHLKYGVPKGSPGMRFVRRQLETYIGMRVMNAVAKGDAEFFERCKDALRRDLPRDPSGVRVLEAVLRLATSSGCPTAISSVMILNELQRRFPGESPLEAKDVRDVLKGLGIKCPVNRDRIRDEVARERAEDRERMSTTPEFLRNLEALLETGTERAGSGAAREG